MSQEMKMPYAGLLKPEHLLLDVRAYIIEHAPFAVNCCCIRRD